MNEEITNKGIELTDEEMDNISGGRAMIINTQGRTYYTCNHKKISAQELLANLPFNKNTCDHYKGIKTDIKSCGECSHFREQFYRLSPDEIDQKGYDVMRR
jgi:hypothetical protein